MSGLAGFAAAAAAMAARAEASLARDGAEAGAHGYLIVLHSVTPVRSGKLRDSEQLHALSGNGAYAIALAGPNVIYDRFRDGGGTIHVRTKRVLSDGVSFFGKQVTQGGSHYMERARAEAGPIVAAAVKGAADRIITL